MADHEQRAPHAQNPGTIPPPVYSPTMPTTPGMAYSPWTPSATGAPPPLPKPPRIRFSRQNVLILSVVGGVLLLILLAGVVAGIVVVVSHVFSKPDGYLLDSETTVAFIQFTEDQNGHLTGSLQSVYATGDNTVQNESAAFTGVRNGSQISLTFSALGFSATVTGTLNGDTLTLRMPDQNGYVATEVFRAASTADYNAAANKLRQRISGFAAATEAAQATVTQQQAVAQATSSTQNALDQAVIDANNRLSSDLSQLKADIQHLAGNTDFSGALDAYASDWSRMQQDYQKEQSDYQQGCGDNGYNAGVVAYDAGVVSYDLGTIQYDDSSFGYDKDTVTSAITQVQSDMQAVQTDWQNLQSAQAADSIGSATAALSQDDVNAALAKAQQQIDASNKALDTAQGKANQYDQEAAQMNTDAQNLSDSMHC